MAIEGVVEKATIKFPRALDLGSTSKLILYISEKLPGRINCNINQYQSAVYNEKENTSQIENGTLKISGNIIPVKNKMEFDAFELIPWEEDSSYVSSLKFQDFQRVEPLWNDVRRIIGDYFKYELKVK